MNNFYVGTSLIFMIDILLELEPENRPYLRNHPCLHAYGFAHILAITGTAKMHGRCVLWACV